MEGTGYDIKRLFEATFSHFHSASYGSIYPALGQLQQEGLISLRVEQGARYPDRKVYSITEAGRQAFVSELTQTAPSEQLRSELLVLTFFAHLLPGERLAQVLDQAARQYRESLTYLESVRDHPSHSAGIRFTIDMGIASLRAKLECLSTGRDALLAGHLTPPRIDTEEATCDA